MKKPDSGTRRPKSLQVRLVGAATITLALFLAATGWVLDRVFAQSVTAAAQDRLRVQVYMLLGAADADTRKQLVLPDSLPDPRLATPDSGLYAQILDDTEAVIWRSQSLLGRSLSPPPVADPGTYWFFGTELSDGSALYALAYGVIWEFDDGSERRYLIQAAEDTAIASAQVIRFRRSLSLWFGGIVMALLVTQFLVLRWGLTPLRQVSLEVREVEAGRRDAISDDYPIELRPLTVNLNRLLRSGRNRLTRYRDALADLAHSLKTPLAVIRATIDRDSEAHAVLFEQLDRVEQSIDYHLTKAAAAGRSALGKAIDVEPVLRKLVAAMRKVHQQRHIAIELRVAAGAHFLGDESDLYEIAGNLVDNACKWAHAKVAIAAAANESGGLRLVVSDDGPGIPAADLPGVLERGVRADERVPGYGIGLAIVRQLVEEIYEGSLHIDSGTDGTQVTVVFGPVG